MTAPREVTPVVGPVRARLRPPGSKSLTNRALVAAALAPGISTLRGALAADDTEAMIDCLAALGISCEVHGDEITVTGTGGALAPGPLRLDARLSGTTARFIAAVLTLGEGPYVLDGAEPMRARPMADGLDAIAGLGVSVEPEQVPGHLPVRISGGPVAGGSVTVRGDASSQFLSGLLLAAAGMPSGLTIQLSSPLVSEPYVAMTASVMEAFGATVTRRGDTWRVEGPYSPAQFEIEPDASAASYLFAAAAICGGEVTVTGLGPDSTQGDLGFVEVLERMGAGVKRSTHEITVTGTGTLRGIESLDLSELSDTAQTAAVVATLADSPTTIEGIGFIRHKETDRIGNTVAELQRCGIDATELDDGMRIVPGAARPAEVRTYEDHRMAMAFALLGLVHPGIRIADPDCVAKTYPRYWEDLESLRASAAG